MDRRGWQRAEDKSEASEEAWNDLSDGEKAEFLKVPEQEAVAALQDYHKTVICEGVPPKVSLKDVIGILNELYAEMLPYAVKTVFGSQYLYLVLNSVGLRIP